ncbi:MAG: glycosyltransferase [Candidatus Liptonbacteria bacterium]|nr:glycosyltransferase [Candidatus Liptonbacteria bacterium]
MLKPFLSVIIPVKNEANRLPLTLVDIDERLSTADYSSEIVVASYGSTDGTPDIVKKMSSVLKNLKLVVSAKNKGIGFATRQGMLLSSGEVKLLTNVDNLIKIDEFNHMLPLFKEGHEVVIGSRIPGQDFKLPIWRSRKMIFTKLANLVLRASLFKGLSDPTSNFRAFKEEAAEKVFNLAKANFSSANLETLFLARKNNLRIKEVPVFTSAPTPTLL